MRTRVLTRAAVTGTFASLALGAPSHAATAPLGLGPPRDHVEARGVQVARPPIEGRVRIPAATFVMGSTRVEMKDAVELCRREVLHEMCVSEEMPVRNIFRMEGVAHEVALSAFALDRVEVRVRDFRRCVEVGACTPAAFTPGDARFDRPELPVVQVTWDQANAYCAWTGARLPTEAEWELAARGTARRIYPWGQTYNPYLANHGALAEDDTDASDGFARLAPVGSFPDGATPEGVLDLAGNAGEWVADFFDPDNDDAGYASTAQTNPRGPLTGVLHVVRGGSYRSGAPWVRGAARAFSRLGRADDVGFRCAADVR